MFDENSNATAATLVGPAGTTPTLHTANLNSTHIMNHLLTGKDSRWLQLEVCREFQRGQCSRSDVDCKFAHPPPHVDSQNGRVTACYDSIKGRCTRENPKCKYLHPPQHLKDQLLINGRNNLAIKNLLCSQLAQPAVPTNLQMAAAHLMQQQQQPLMPTLPYHQFYSTPQLTAAGLYPLLPAATTDYQVQTPTPPLVIQQQLALLQQQHQKAQLAAAVGSAAGGSGLPLANGANTSSVTAAQQAQHQAILNALLKQQADQQSAAAASLQFPYYGVATSTASPPASALNHHQALLLQQQLAASAALGQNVQHQQAALMSALAASQQQQYSAQAVQAAASLANADSRKRNARVAGFEEPVTAEEKRSTASLQGAALAYQQPTTSAASNAVSSASAASSASTAQQPAQNFADLASIHNQLLLAAAASANNAANNTQNGKRHMKDHAIPIYAQQPTAAQFSPYLLPGYVPVSYSGQLPPRF